MLLSENIYELLTLSLIGEEIHEIFVSIYTAKAKRYLRSCMTVLSCPPDRVTGGDYFDLVTSSD